MIANAHKCRYVNFASGDESAQEIYGQSLSRLHCIKKRYDPNNVFNQWFNIVV